MTQNGKQVQFHIWLNVIEEHLPFVIAFPSQRAIDGILSFNHKNFSTVVSKVFYRIQSVHETSHLYLPLRSAPVHSRALNESGNIATTAGHRRVSRKQNSSEHHCVSAALYSDEAQQRKKTATSFDSPCSGMSSRHLNTKKRSKLHTLLGHAILIQVRRFIRDTNQ